MAKNVHVIEIKLEKEWKEALDKSFKKASKDVKVDGFRKGSVPKEIFIKKYGIESLYEEACNIAMEDAFQNILKDKKLEPVVKPSVDVTGISDSNVMFKFTIVTKPEVKLGEYKNLGIKKETVKVAKKELDEEVTKLQESMSDFKVKEKGKVENKDTAVINFKGFVDGKELEGGSGEDYPLEIGSNSFIPGFEEKLIGLKTGEKTKLELKFPENYVDHLKGKDVTFEVEIKEIKTKVLPELDKTFFEDLGYKDMKTVEELHKELEKTLKEKKEKENEDKFIDKCLEKATKNMKVEINEEIIDEEIHRMIDQYSRQLQMQGMNLETYFEMTGTTHEDLHKQMNPEAKKRVEFRYLIEAVADAEKVDFTKKEVDKNAKEMAEKYNISVDELLKAYGSLDVIKYDMKMQKALEIIKENN